MIQYQKNKSKFKITVEAPVIHRKNDVIFQNMAVMSQ